MGKVTRGLKAGVLSGLIIGVILGAVTYATMVLWKEEYLAYFQQIIEHLQETYGPLPITAEALYQYSLNMSFISAILGAVIFGLLFGAVFGWKYEKFPGSPIVKGLIMGLIVAVVSLVIAYGIPGVRTPFFGGVETFKLAFSIVMYLVWGVLTSIFYWRWIPKEAAGAG